MTCQKTVAWMKEKGIYDRWLTPINFDKQFGRHANHRPPGNSPELMPWQGGQFTQQRSERRALLFHSCLTHELHEDDDLKFSLSAPNNRMTKAFRRILKQGWPSSKLVIQDGCRKSIGRWPSRKFQLRRGRRPGRTSEAAGDDLLLSPPTNLRCTLVESAAVERLRWLCQRAAPERTTLVRVRWVSPHVVGTCGVDGSGGLFYVPTAAGRKNIASMLIAPALGY